ncbi:MAG: ABC transporter substrate-binding protein, partial [Pirellulales bacterium]
MKHHHRIQKHRFAKTYASSGPLCVLLVVAIAFLGCTRDKGGKSAETNGGKTEDAESGEFELGDLVESFDPPELAELEKTVEWRDMPVVDSLELMRERQANETPLATVEEALELRNDSAENNAKIVSALGRVAKDVSEANENAEWLRHTSGDVKSTNPLMSSSAAEADVNGLTSIGMFGFDWNFNPHAGADSVVTWQTSKDGLYDKVIMRDDMTWSDGKPVTAHDVEFSYKVIMSSQVPVPAVRSGTDQLKWVQAYDDHTVVFFHKEPMATNIWNITFPIIPKHIFEKSIAEDPTLSKSPYHVKQDEIPVTGGAYVIKKRSRGQEIVLTRRESYYMHDGKQVRDKPYFKDVRFKIIIDPSTSLLALKKGEIEEMTLTPEQWQTQTNDEVFYANNTKVYGLEWVYFYFGWNCKTPYFSDKRVRKAMSYAFDHEEMLVKHRFGMDEACTGIYHGTSRWAPQPAPEPYKQNLKKAEQL